MKQIFILYLFCAFMTPNGWSQEVTSDSTKKELYVIVRHDGVEYVGEILSDDGREVLILTEELGKIYLPKYDIQSITKIVDEENVVFGEYRQDGPFTTRYSFTTNALPIKKGENYALINLYGPEAHFALSDQFSLGVMSSWIVSPLVLAGKYTFKTNNEKINLSLGSLMGTSGYLNNFRGYGGLHFANLTVGSRSKNITFSGGYAHLVTGSRDYFSEPGIVTNDEPYYYSNSGNLRIKSPVHGPIISIAGIAKVGAKASFVFDSMLGVFSQRTVATQTTTIEAEYYDNELNEYVPGTYQHETIAYTARTTALFIMPGMRFQKTDKMAFQVSLAGVSVFEWINPVSGANNFSFPAPMCMWFLKF